MSEYAVLDPDCTFTYAFAGNPRPDFTIDPANGSVSFINEAAAEATLSFSVVVTGTMVNDPAISNDVRVGPLEVTTNCGLGSTAITFDAMDEKS